MKISVLLAEDNDVLRKVIADLLNGDPEIELVAKSIGFAQTIELAAKLLPQVIVLDVHMRDERAVTPSQIKSSLNVARLLAISIWKDDETQALAKAMGAIKLLDKTKLADELIPAIKLHARESFDRIDRSK
jgi:chemotaxis response regulator CheB